MRKTLGRRGVTCAFRPFYAQSNVTVYGNSRCRHRGARRGQRNRHAAQGNRHVVRQPLRHPRQRELGGGLQRHFHARGPFLD